MKAESQIYLVCPKYKGRPKKHLDVCIACRWRGSCPAYQRHRQPDLPFTFPPKKS